MTGDNDQYEITEADVDSVLRYLKLTNPKQAKPEVAIKILERLHARLHTLEHVKPEAIEQILRDLEKE